MKKNNKPKKVQDILQFYQKAEKLKTTMRHSWLSDISRQESSAEHSWMLSLLAIILADQLDTSVDQLKTLKLVIVHDLAEALTGDIPSFEISSRQNGKHEAEKKALKSIVSTLPKKAAKEILTLWQEFEDCQTPEAK